VASLSLLIPYTWIWISSLTFWMQQRRNTDFWPIKTLNFGNWASWCSYDFLKILTIWASFSYKLFSFKQNVYVLILSTLTFKMVKYWALTLYIHCRIHKLFINYHTYNYRAILMKFCKLQVAFRVKLTL